MKTKLVESLKALMTAHCDVNLDSHDNRYYTKNQINTKVSNYLPLSGGTMTGRLTFSDDGSGLIQMVSPNTTGHAFRRDMSFYHHDDLGTLVGGIGMSGTDGRFGQIYLSMSEAPWNPSNGLTITQNAIKWKGVELATKNYVTANASSSNHNHDSSYLKLSGGTMTGKITVPVVSSSWNNGRTNAAIRTVAVNGYSPVLSIKSSDGSWELGDYQRGTTDDYLYLSHMADSDIANGGNVPTGQIKFDKRGYVVANLFEGPARNVKDYYSSANVNISADFNNNTMSNGNYFMAVANNNVIRPVYRSNMSVGYAYRLCSSDGGTTGRSAGSSSQPVYFSSGIPYACTKSPALIGVNNATASELNRCAGLTYTVQNEFNYLEQAIGVRTTPYGNSNKIINLGISNVVMRYDNCLAAPLSNNSINTMIGNNNSIKTWYNFDISNADACSNNHIFGYNNHLGYPVNSTSTSSDFKSSTVMWNNTIIGNSNSISSYSAKNTIIGNNNMLNQTSKSSVCGNNIMIGNSNYFSGVDTSLNSACIGHSNRAFKSPLYSYAIGYNNTISYSRCFCLGWNVTGYGQYAMCAGYQVHGYEGQTSFGHYNNPSSTGASSGTTTGDLLTLGNGTSTSRANAFRVTGQGMVYSTKGTIQSGADYAEYFEYGDGNPSNEDRVGYFITFDTGRKIRKACSQDTYILGISSGNPASIGNGDECWNGRYVKDYFDRFIEEKVLEPFPTNDDDGNTIYENKLITKWKENKDYDPNQEYIQRWDRPEWEAVGMLGVLAVYDNETCEIDGYCTVGDGGIAIPCEYSRDYPCYRVLERLSNNIIRVLFRN